MIIQTPDFEQIKNSISPFENLLTGSDELWKHTNCYSFALGLTFLGDKSKHYYPGFTEKDLEIDKTHSLIDCVTRDLENLGLQFRTAYTQFDTYPLARNEYVIKPFISQSTERLPNGDFHFIRRSPNGTWYHKIGWVEAPVQTICSDGIRDFKGVEFDDFVYYDTTDEELYQYNFAGKFFIIKN